MATKSTKKPTAKKLAAKKSTVKKRAIVNKPQTRRQKLAAFWQRQQQRRRNFLSRRPHRSFKRTLRRDYVRSLELPGYFKFTRYIFATLGSNHKALWRLGLIMIILMVATNSFSAISQNYSSVGQLMDSVKGSDLGQAFGAVGQAALVSLSMLSSGMSSSGDQTLQILTGFILMFVWLAVVWLLRATQAGNKVQLRDALYSCGAPIVATFLLLLYMFLQAVPAMITVIIYNALSSVGYISDGFGAMLFWVFAIIVLVLTLYWMTATFFALIIVTLPGMRPMQALRVAGDMVVGRRLKLMLRLIWMLIIALAAWLLLVIIFVMFDSWLKSVWSWISWLPLVPIIISIMNTFVAMWLASYVYLLYRKVVDDDAKPA